jgi:NADPH:quinone reductase-like Zn-dependent oxidoreductase
VKAVRFDEYGGVDVLKVVDVPRPVPRAGQVLVQVKAAGINPGEAKIRVGLEDSTWPATFPSGQGSDLAGIVAETGPGVTSFSADDEIIGWTDNRASQAEYVVVEEQHLTAKPAGVPWEEAGALFVAGTTAYAAVRAVGLTGGDTVAVSAAAGGVGSIAVQLARQAGATVIGLASEAHHPWLAGHGVIPVAYGDEMADRIRQAASKVDAFIDTFGAGYVQLALELGVEPSRIDTIVNFEAVARYGVNAEGNAAAATASVLAELAGLIAAGELELPIAATFPLDRVQDAILHTVPYMLKHSDRRDRERGVACHPCPVPHPAPDAGSPGWPRPCRRGHPGPSGTCRHPPKNGWVITRATGSAGDRPSCAEDAPRRPG